MKSKIYVERGVMIVKDGKAWGSVPTGWDHPTTTWVDPIHGQLHKPEFIKKPSDILSPHSLSKEEIDLGKIVPVERVTHVTVTFLD